MPSSMPHTTGSNRSTSSGLSRCDLASGVVTFGWSITNVGSMMWSWISSLNSLSSSLAREMSSVSLHVEPRRDLLEHRHRQLHRVRLDPRGQRVHELHPLPRPSEVDDVVAERNLGLAADLQARNLNISSTSAITSL